MRHRHFADTIHPTIIFQRLGVCNRHKRTARIRGNLDDLASVTLAVLLLALKIETNLNRSKLAHLQLSCGDTLILHFISAFATKKNSENRAVIFSPLPYCHTIWHKICWGLPFWQILRDFCHFGRLPLLPFWQVLTAQFGWYNHPFGG
jgi:hypothetical protein